MLRNPGKSFRKVLKARRERRRVLQMERDTVYWLCFVPKSGPAPSAQEDFDPSASPWCIRLFGNPKRNPDFITLAVREFETKHNVKSWEELAIGHNVYRRYAP